MSKMRISIRFNERKYVSFNVIKYYIKLEELIRQSKHTYTNTVDSFFIFIDFSLYIGSKNQHKITFNIIKIKFLR